MAKLTRSTVFTSADPQKETPLDKTTRIVREIQYGEAEQRRIKTTRLRNTAQGLLHAKTARYLLSLRRRRAVFPRLPRVRRIPPGGQITENINDASRSNVRPRVNRRP